MQHPQSHVVKHAPELDVWLVLRQCARVPCLRLVTRCLDGALDECGVLPGFLRVSLHCSASMRTTVSFPRSQQGHRPLRTFRTSRHPLLSRGSRFCAARASDKHGEVEVLPKRLHGTGSILRNAWAHHDGTALRVCGIQEIGALHACSCCLLGVTVCAPLRHRHAGSTRRSLAG